ncbi:MAG: EAL domain-containing protein [Heteroscytonema crispum UTEX LB 1556]
MTREKKSENIPKNHLDEMKLGTAKPSGQIDDFHPQTSYLHNFLEPYESFISKLIIELINFQNQISKNSDIANHLLSIIKYSSAADFVFVMRNDSQDNWFIKAQSDLSENIERSAYFHTLNSIIFPIISRESVFNPAHHGTYKIQEYQKRISTAFVLIPLKSPPEAELLVVCGLPQDSYLLGDAYGRIISSFYQASQNLSLQPTLVEAAILDDLKSDFGFVSASLYDRRLQLFCERLKGMIVYFEPILHLDPEDLFISGWEALARNPDSLTAPSDLFYAAELWGPRFILELDLYFLTTATESYREARQKAKQNRSQEIMPLSVNVYPESLMRKAYFETVRQIIKDKVISPRHLILEISEKAEVPKYYDGNLLESPLTFFKNRLLEYVRQFNIRFAIDDFGVGYASVSRLAGLNPSYVKIDREILHHQPTEVILRFVHEMVGVNNLNPANVIVEGVDETTPISLHKLREIGVSYIQGHIISKPTPEIYRLTLEKSDFLKKLILDVN